MGEVLEELFCYKQLGINLSVLPLVRNSSSQRRMLNPHPEPISTENKGRPKSVFFLVYLKNPTQGEPSVGAEGPEGLESSKSCQEGENLLVFCRNVGFAFPRVKSSPEQGGTKHKGNSRDTPPASRDKFHPFRLDPAPRGMVQLQECRIKPRQGRGRASALQEFCSQFILQKAPRLFFHRFPLSGAGSAELHPWSYFLTLLRLDEVVVMV